jgi:hypothetical protein
MVVSGLNQSVDVILGVDASRICQEASTQGGSVSIVSRACQVVAYH